MPTTKKIREVEFVREVDDAPDLSHLGEYEREPGRPEVTVDRRERGDMGRNEYRYFVATMSGAETGNPESVGQDYKRMEGYNRSEWCMCFCYAAAEVVVNGVIQRIRSGGVGGIESDSGDDYFAEMKREQLSELSGILKELGFADDEVGRAVAACKEKA